MGCGASSEAAHGGDAAPTEPTKTEPTKTQTLNETNKPARTDEPTQQGGQQPSSDNPEDLLALVGSGDDAVDGKSSSAETGGGALFTSVSTREPSSGSRKLAPLPTEEEKSAKATKNDWMERAQEKPPPLSDAELTVLRQRFKTLLDRDGDSTVTLEEFSGALKEAKPHFSDLLAKRLFAAFDTDKNGSMSLREFEVGIASIAKKSLDEQIMFAFDVYDADGDARLSRDEVTEMLRAHLIGSTLAAREVVQVMEVEDFDDDGLESIPLDEGPALDGPQRLEIEQNVKDFVEAIFEADTNSDGFITREELQNWTKDPNAHIMDKRILTKFLALFASDMVH
mmetsp:Transcript_20519/g.66624  ORF Transcript_20519/g.66624 Transcript_20519/m.66624 type:complete len:339 (-) Transcript_20519:33-1049(-)